MNNQNDCDSLRKKAEKLAYDVIENGKNLEVEKALVHELQVHQIELELQNDELKRVQCELELSKKHYLNLFNNAPVGYILLLADGTITQSNLTALKLLDINNEKIIKTKIHKFIYIDDQDKFYLFNKTIINKNESYTCELRLVKNDGSTFWANIQVVLEENIEQEYIYKVIIEDITERKTLENNLKIQDNLLIMKSKQAAMGEMLSMIAHQWRQPLSIISTATSSMEVYKELNDLSDEEFTSNCTLINKNVQYLSETINVFSNFLKPKNDRNAVTVCEVLNNALGLISKSLENNGISISLDTKCVRSLNINGNELLQVFLIILNNAKDNLGINNVENPKITIVEKESDENILIEICDNGGGIPQNIMSKLGEPYFSTKGKNGTGLGLYITKLILEKHMNGSLEWENKNDGACFRITLNI